MGEEYTRPIASNRKYNGVSITIPQTPAATNTILANFILDLLCRCRTSSR